jgi:hypothetical protein
LCGVANPVGDGERKRENSHLTLHEAIQMLLYNIARWFSAYAGTNSYSSVLRKCLHHYSPECVDPPAKRRKQASGIQESVKLLKYMKTKDVSVKT